MDYDKKRSPRTRGDLWIEKFCIQGKTVNKNIVFIMTLIFVAHSSLLGMGFGRQDNTKIKSFATMTEAEKLLFKAKNAQDVKKALDEGADINVQNIQGVTPLFDWVDNFYVNDFYKNQDDFIKMLKLAVQAKADLNVFDTAQNKVLINWYYPSAQGLIDNIIKKHNDNAKYKNLITYLKNTFNPPTTFNDKVNFIIDEEKAGNPVNDVHYLISAINNGDIAMIDFLLKKTGDTPLYAFKLIVGQSLPTTLVPYFLYTLDLKPQDLQFLEGKEAPNLMAQRLQKIYEKAQAKSNAIIETEEKEVAQNQARAKAFGKAMLDYYLLLKEYHGASGIALLNLIAHDEYFPVVLVPSLLYALNLDLKDLEFLAVPDDQKMAVAKSSMAKNLLFIFSLAKEKGNKAFGKVMLDYYALLKKYGDSNEISPEVMREVFSFLGKDDISALVSVQKSKPKIEVIEEEKIDLE
jgi:hypothetical protein